MSRRLAVLLAMGAALLALPTLAHAATLTDAEELGRFGSEGTGAGQLHFPGAIAADPTTGHLYVASFATGRIDEFTPWGEFVKAFGFDVAPGAVDETQEVRVRAGAGTFKLGFEGAETPDLPYDATAAEVKAALDALATIGGAGGEVAVSESLGKPETATPYVYVVAFKGALAGTNVAQLEAKDGAVPLSAGDPETTLEARTRAEGTSGGTGLESCTAESGCKAGEEGAGAGQIERQSTGIAVDAAGDLYVAERFIEPPESPRLQKFTPSGHFVWMIGGEVDKTTNANLCTAASGHECGAATVGSAPGQFGSALRVAIAPDGDVLVASGRRIQRFNPGGEYQSEIEVSATEKAISSLAVDPLDGHLYDVVSVDVGGGVSVNQVHELDPVSGETLATLEVARPNLLATDPAGNVFVKALSTQNQAEAEAEGGNRQERVIEFDPEGNRLSVFAESEAVPGRLGERYFLNAPGANALGDLYVPYSNNPYGAFVRFFGPPPVSLESPPLVAPQIATQYASSVGPREAEVKAKIDPRFWNDATYRVQYGTAPCEEGGCAETANVKLTSKVAGSPIATQGVLLEGLDPGTTYHYRFVAQSTGGGPTYGPDRTFITYRLPTPQSCPANEAFRAGASANLPDCRAYEMVSPVDKEGGDIAVLQTDGNQLPASLDQSATSGDKLTYGSYRAFGGAQSAPWTSQYLATRHAGEGWSTRAISPPRSGESFFGVLPQAHPEFQAFSPDLCEGWLESFAEPPLAPGAPAGGPDLYRRTDSGCGGPSFAALNTTATPSGVHLHLQGVSSDGGTAVFATTPQEGVTQVYGAGEGVQRFLCALPSGRPSEVGCTMGGALANAATGQREILENALSADGSKAYWSTVLPDERIYLRLNPLAAQSALAHGAATGTGTLGEESTTVKSLVALKAKVSLVKESTVAEVLETKTGQLAVGQPLAGTGIASGTTVASCAPDPECGPGTQTIVLSKAATQTATPTITSKGPMPFAVGQTIVAPGIPDGTTIAAVAGGELTLSQKATITQSATALEAFSACSEAAKACTLAVSSAAEAQAGAGNTLFRGAAADGSKAIFTAGHPGTDPSLFEYRPADRSTHPIAAKVLGVMGMSEDASRIYLVSREALGGANAEGKSATEGKPNLYLWEAGTFRFVGVLESSGRFSAIAEQPPYRSARVSADGLHAAFTSTSSMTGYDNTDRVDGEPDGEVYLYDATANGGEGGLLCASCNPGGARPVASDKYPNDGTPSAARIPGFANNFLYASRVLSTDGDRLFFDAFDPLVPADTNGTWDVYQWEAPGTGGCKESSPPYSPRNQGCVELISSGKSQLPSEFLDASPEGSDVFFTTASSLVPADPGQQDVYDARAGGGLPEPPPPAPRCEGEACQGTPAAPDDPTPASETFQGAGNVREEASEGTKARSCGKGKVRRKGRCVAKRHHKAKHAKRHHKRRARHDRGAGR